MSPIDYIIISDSEDELEKTQPAKQEKGAAKEKFLESEKRMHDSDAYDTHSPLHKRLREGINERAQKEKEKERERDDRERREKDREKEKGKGKEKEKEIFPHPRQPLSRLPPKLTDTSYTPSPGCSLSMSDLDIGNNSLQRLLGCGKEELLSAQSRYFKKLLVVNRALEITGVNPCFYPLPDPNIQEEMDRRQYREIIRYNPSVFCELLVGAQMIFAPDPSETKFYKDLKDLTINTQGYQQSPVEKRCGLLGEAFVYLVLSHFMEGEGEKVEWLNQDKESYKPFDIKVNKYYLEIKSTTVDKTYYKCSFNEVASAHHLKENYWLVRVFHLMDNKMENLKFKCFRNPSQLETDGDIGLFMSV